MGFRCALLGCGGRAKGHAQAYAHVHGGELVAICDMDEARLKAFGEDYGIAARYTDLDEMLRQERPDVVHIVTQPTLRVPLMTQVAEAGVPGAIVEKPICLGGDDYKALRALEARSATKFAVNHQLRHHPRILEFLGDVEAGRIGEVRFLDASCVLPMAGQGVHALDLVFAFNGYAPAVSVLGAAYGWNDLSGTHPSPRSSETLVTFANGARAVIQSGEGAPVIGDGPNYMNKRIAVYGTNGFVHWRMNGWERGLADGTVEAGEHDYRAEDVLGQAGLTMAMFDWLEDETRVHPNNLAVSLDEWLVLLGQYMSTVERRIVDLPFGPADDLLEQYRRVAGKG